jgi:hypothetical protein
VGWICLFVATVAVWQVIKEPRSAGFIAGTLTWFAIGVFGVRWGFTDPKSEPKVEREIHGSWPKDKPDQ